jgi:hypothetical protein
MAEPVATPSPTGSEPATSTVDPHWLLLVHQIPPKPDYLRVKIGRRLQRIGAVAIKNSVYALPGRADTYEDFQWIAREIREGGGDALIAEATIVEGLSDASVRALFDSARDEDYAELLADGRTLGKALGTKRSSRSAVRRRQLEQELARLRRRFESVTAIDFFGAPKRRLVATLLDDLGRTLAPAPAEAAGRGATPGEYHRRTWVTRRDVHVDRIASAWLIRRFIDPAARFRFVDPERHVHRAGELRFDMFDGEFTHHGDACTFESLASRFVPHDGAVREIGEIVHDVDCKDGKFQREEAPGLRRMIAGIVAAHRDDDARRERGAALFDDLHAAFTAHAGEPR